MGLRPSEAVRVDALAWRDGYYSSAMQARHKDPAFREQFVKELAREVFIRGDEVILQGYPIKLEYIRTPERLAYWVFHLTEKAWVEAEHLRYFMWLVARHHGYKLYGQL